jgi:hypothetical protein
MQRGIEPEPSKHPALRPPAYFTSSHYKYAIC